MSILSQGTLTTPDVLHQVYIPPSATTMKFTLIGGGGGGSYGGDVIIVPIGNSINNYTCGGGGGGSGLTLKDVVVDVIGKSSFTAVVGNGGAAGSFPFEAKNGGDTVLYLDANERFVASGGKGGGRYGVGGDGGDYGGGAGFVMGYGTSGSSGVPPSVPGGSPLGGAGVLGNGGQSVYADSPTASHAGNGNNGGNGGTVSLPFSVPETKASPGGGGGGIGGGNGGYSNYISPGNTITHNPTAGLSVGAGGGGGYSETQKFLSAIIYNGYVDGASGYRGEIQYTIYA